jgi:recombination associated protein RdgC
VGFFSGRATFARYRVDRRPPRMFTEEHLAKLAAHAAGRQRVISADGVEAGWTAGDHILDMHFDLAKNVINDLLFFSLRIDSQKLPADLLRAYYAIDLAALAKRNPSGLPSARQKREAKESARDRLEQEAKDGRFRRRKAIELVWDLKSNELLFGTTSVSLIDRLLVLFKTTFGCGFEAVTAGRRAYALAEVHGRTRTVDDASPSPFIPGLSPKDVAWIPDDASRDFVGNEFLLWLWYQCDDKSATIQLLDRSEATVFIARTLTLECPRGQTGYETITHEGPARLPEAMRAIRSGKLPRKCGLTVVRHDVQYELTLHAETLAVGAAKIPPPEEEADRARLEARAQQLRDLIETLDLVFDAFGRVRFSAEWPKELAKMQRWLSREERRAG